MLPNTLGKPSEPQMTWPHGLLPILFQRIIKSARQTTLLIMKTRQHSYLSLERGFKVPARLRDSSLRNQGAHHLLITTKPASHTVFSNVPKHNFNMILCAMRWLSLGCEYIQLRNCYQSHLLSVFGHLQKPRKGIPASPTRWIGGNWNSSPLLLKAETALKS